MTHTTNGPVIVFLGPPGSGKGSQSKLLSKNLNLPHISTGDLLRTYSKGDSDLAKTVKTTLDRGEFLSNDLIVAMLKERIQERDCQEGFILDGFPRTLDQSKILDETLANSESVVFVNVQLSSAVIIDRLSQRRTCQNCSKIYHLEFAPPKREESCDDCGGDITQRADDAPEVIKKRLEIFNNEFQPMLKYYQDRANWIELDATQSIEQCFENLLENIGPLIPAPITS